MALDEDGYAKTLTAVELIALLSALPPETPLTLRQNWVGGAELVRDESPYDEVWKVL